MVAKQRDSAIELYRIIVMLAIVAHHYVGKSGLIASLGSGHDAASLFLLEYGAWGKIGINCFVLITGYFMCTANITLNKFLKLCLQVLFYKVCIGLVFFATGYETGGILKFALRCLPVTNLSTGFVSCFTVFFLLIPFLNVLVANLDRRLHGLLIAMLIFFFSFMPTVPSFVAKINYVEWFVILYFISSYLRKYPNRFTENRRLCVILSLVLLLCEGASIWFLSWHINFDGYYLVADVNKITALALSLCLFLTFKPLNQSWHDQTRIAVRSSLIPYNKAINLIASATFGVLLIHANSAAMHQWLWRDVCNCTEWYKMYGNSLWLVIVHAVGSVTAVFIICVLIDLLRQRFVERPFFMWLDRIFERRKRPGCGN